MGMRGVSGLTISRQFRLDLRQKRLDAPTVRSPAIEVGAQSDLVAIGGHRELEIRLVLDRAAEEGVARANSRERQTRLVDDPDIRHANKGIFEAPPQDAVGPGVAAMPEQQVELEEGVDADGAALLGVHRRLDAR